jgi:hypothetical protein
VFGLCAGGSPFPRNDKPCIETVDDVPIEETLKGLFDQDFHAVKVQPGIIAIRLIQSQPQLGPASAKAFEYHAQHFSRVLSQDRFKGSFCRIGDLHVGTLLDFIDVQNGLLKLESRGHR